jgi:hypothetical protein
LKLKCDRLISKLCCCQIGRRYAPALRLSICRGNGLYPSGDKERGCDCMDDWRGVDCEIPCLACANGQCVLGPALPDGNGSTACECALGWAGALCDIQCPACDYTHGACVTDTEGKSTCECQAGWGGAFCQHACPPCDYARANCNATTYHGRVKGGSVACLTSVPLLFSSLLFSSLLFSSLLFSSLLFSSLPFYSLLFSVLLCYDCLPIVYPVHACVSLLHGEYPGTYAKCVCIDPVLSTGLLCELQCPGAPGFCGQGECLHSLEVGAGELLNSVKE